MKIQVVLCVIFIVSAGAVIFEKERNECLAELNLDATVLNAIDKEVIVTLPNEDFGKLKACLYIKRGLLTKSGRILWDAAKNVLIAELKANDEVTKKYNEAALIAEIEKTLNICKKQDLLADTAGEAAIKLRNCLLASQVAQEIHGVPNQPSSE